MGKEKQHTTDPDKTFVTFLEKHTKDGYQQESKRVVSGNNSVFIEHEVAETEEQFLEPIERRVANEKVDGHTRNQEMEHLHHDRGMCDTAEWH